MSQQTWGCAQSKQETCKALKHALSDSEHEKAAYRRHLRQAFDERKESVRTSKHAYWEAKAVALEADFPASEVHAI